MAAKYSEELAEWARGLLSQRGLTLRAAEVLTGVNYSTINSMVAGRTPDPTTLMKFAAGLGQDIPAALRMAGYEDFATLWESGKYPRREFTPEEASEQSEEVLRIRRAIGRRVRLRLDALGMTQIELARLIGKTQGTVSGYLTGRVAMETVDLAKIAAALQISVAKLFGEDELDEDADGNRARLIAFYDEVPPDTRDTLLAIAETLWREKRAKESVIGRKAE